MSVAVGVSDVEVRRAFKSESFKTEFLRLYKKCLRIIELSYGNYTGQVESLTNLELYYKIFVKCEPREHYKFFESVYNRHAPAIHKTLLSDSWLLTNKVTVQFGEDHKNAEIFRHYNIQLSEFYTLALQVQKTAEQKRELVVDIPDDLKEELTMARGFLLHLMRIFYHLNDGDDKMAVVVSTLETELNVATRTVGSEPWVAKKPITANGSLVNTFFGFATNLLQSAGFDTGQNTVPPNEEEVTKVVSGVLENPMTKNTITTIFEGLKGCDTIESAMQNVVKVMTNPNTMQDVAAIARSADDTVKRQQQGHQSPAVGQQSSVPGQLPPAVLQHMPPVGFLPQVPAASQHNAPVLTPIPPASSTPTVPTANLIDL